MRSGSLSKRAFYKSIVEDLQDSSMQFYSSRHGTSDWYEQVYAGSLGKRVKDGIQMKKRASCKCS